MAAITTVQVEKLIEEQRIDIDKWAYLKVDKIYTCVNAKIIETEYGESRVLTLIRNGEEVWAPGHMKKRITPGDTMFYFRPLGLKPCK